MARKKKQPDRAPQHTLRFDGDAAILDALDRYAEDKRQSRNAAILTILEAALRASGHLTPPTSPPTATTE